MKSARREAILLALVSVLAVPPASAIDWNAGAGIWNVPANWDPVGVPTAADLVFVRDPGLIETITVTASASVLGLTVADVSAALVPDTISVNNGVQFLIDGSGFVNDGRFELNSTVSFTTLNFSGADQSLSGQGEVVLGDRTANRIILGAPTLTLTHGGGVGTHTIRGAGQLLGNSGGLVNFDTIVAEGTNALVVDPNALGVTNQGLMIGRGAGGLTLQNGVFTNTGGTISAEDASKVRIVSSTIVGGTLETVDILPLGDGGIFEIAGANTFDGITVDRQGGGSVEQANAASSTIENGLTLSNGAAWNLNSSVSNTNLIFSGTQSVDGDGRIVLSDRTTNRVLGSAGGTLTIESGVTLSGAGNLLENVGSLVNNGEILAQGDNRLRIDIENGLVFQNNAVTRAEGPGGLLIQGTVVNNATALDVDALSKLETPNSVINGGEINIAAGGLYTPVSTTLDGVAITGVVTQANNTLNTIKNDLTLDGQWLLNATVSNTSLSFDGTQQITGDDADVVLSDRTTNRVLIGTGQTLTIDSTATLRGAGNLLENAGSLVNNGEILAQGDNRLRIDIENGLVFQNNAVTRAEGPGGLLIQGTVVNNATALDVDASSKLETPISVINGGEINIAAGGLYTPVSTTLDGVAITGVVTQANNTLNTIKNDLTLDGQWLLNATVSNTSLSFDGSQQITGDDADVVLSDRTTNRVLIGTGQTLTIDSTATLRGAGNLLENAGSLVNNGEILAQGDNRLRIDIENGLVFQNNAVTRAEGPGGLLIQGTVVNNATALDVAAGSKLETPLSTITGGAINIAAGGLYTPSSTTLDGVTINGVATQVNNTTNNIANDLTVNGQWLMNSTVSLTNLIFNGSQKITGSAEIILSDRTTNRVLTGAGETLTIDSTATLRGAGNLLENVGSLVNNGEILAQGDNRLRIDVENGLVFQNNAVTRAEGPGGLLIDGTVVNNATALDVAAGSKLETPSSVIKGGAINIAAGGLYTPSTTTLDGVTINGVATQVNNTTNNIVNDLTVNGQWLMNSTVSLTNLIFNGSQKITGNAELILSDRSTNRVLIGAGETLTIDSAATLRGAGNLLENTGLLVNDGALESNGTNRLIVNTEAVRGFENRGLIVAGGAGLQLTDSYVQTAGTTRVDTLLQLSASIAADIQGGSLIGNGTVDGSVLNSGGTVNPGASAGALEFTDDFTQTGGTFLVEIAGTAPGEFDVLTVGNTATLGGTIAVDLLEPVPGLAVGSVFDVLFANLIDGTFLNGFVDAGRAQFDVSYIGGTTVRLTATNVNPVPVPAALPLLASALMLLARRRG